MEEKKGNPFFMRGGLLLISLLTFAQAKLPLMVDFKMDHCFLDTKELNSELQKYGIAQLPTQNEYLNVGVMFVMNHLFLSWETSGGMPTERIENKKKGIGMSYTSFSMKLGYLFPLNHRLVLAPLIGFGSFEYEFNLFASSPVDFDSLLAGSYTSQNYTLSAKGVGVMMGGKVFISLFHRNKVTVGIEVEGGYPFWTEDSEWKLIEGTPIQGTPRFNSAPPYLSLGLFLK